MKITPGLHRVSSRFVCLHHHGGHTQGRSLWDWEYYWRWCNWCVHSLVVKAFLWISNDFFHKGKVRLAFDKNNGLQVAVKIVRKDLLEDGEMAVKILREIAVMKVLDHDNVLHLYDFYEDLEHM